MLIIVVYSDCRVENSQLLFLNVAESDCYQVCFYEP